MAIYLNNTTKFDILPLDESAHATIYPNSATGFELPPYWRDVPQRVPSPAKAAEGENYPSEPASRTAESRPSEAFRSVRTGMETPYL